MSIQCKSCISTTQPLRHWRSSCQSARFFLAAFAPSLPSAVRVFFGRWAIVFFFFAAAAAFLIFPFAAVRCFCVLMGEGPAHCNHHATVRAKGLFLKRPISSQITEKVMSAMGK